MLEQKEFIVYKSSQSQLSQEESIEFNCAKIDFDCCEY